jgi:hypothetical protein
MISSIHGNAGWLPASHASQVSSSEVPGERENDGDSDDVAGRAKAAASGGFPGYMGNKINTLA